MKFRFWRRDWFLALIVVVIFLALAQSGLVQSLERSAYDLGVSWADRSPGDKVAIIAIDDESISNLGRWPWPRDRLAGMIEELAAGGADVIGNTILLSEPQIDPGLKHLNDLVDLYREWNFGNYSLPGMNRLEQRLLEARRDLNTDAQLAASMAAADNVVLGMQFNLSRSGVVLSRPDTARPHHAEQGHHGRCRGRHRRGLALAGRIRYASHSPTGAGSRRHWPHEHLVGCRRCGAFGTPAGGLQWQLLSVTGTANRRRKPESQTRGYPPAARRSGGTRQSGDPHRSRQPHVPVLLPGHGGPTGL